MNWWGFLYLNIAISLVIHLALRLNQPDQPAITSQPAKIIKERVIIVPEQQDNMRFRFVQ